MVKKLYKNDLHDILFFMFITFLSIHATDGNILQTLFSYAYTLGGVILYARNLSIKKPVFLYTVSWVGIVVLSILWASNKADAGAYVTSLIKIVLISLILTNRIKSYPDLIQIIKLIVWARIICAAVLIIKTPFSDWGTMNIGSAIGLWKNDIGLGFVLSAFLAWTLSVNEKESNKKLEQVFYSVISVVFTVIAFLSGSRKAAIMIVLGVIIYVFVSERNQITRRIIFKRTLQILAIIVVVIALFNFIMTNEVLYHILGERIEAMLMYSQLGTGDESAEERNYYIAQGIELWKMRPLLGVGSNGFVSYLRQIGYSHVAYSHNNFTEILSTTGIVGFFLYYFFPVMTLIRKNPFGMEDGRERRVYVSLWTLMVLFVVFGYWFVYYFDILYNLATLIPCLAAQIIRINLGGNSNET